MNCLLPLRLVILVSFCLAPSSETLLFVILLFQTCSVCALLSAGCRISFPFTSGVCPLVGEAGWEAFPVTHLMVVEGAGSWSVVWWTEPTLNIEQGFLFMLITGALFLTSSDVCVRSFPYLFYTLIKLYYTKSLSNQALSLAPDWILLLQRPRILASFVVQQQSFILGAHPGFFRTR